jgi:hypothetical protein
LKFPLVYFKTSKYYDHNQKVNIILQDEQNLLNEIVVSASRTPERVLESSVTIERNADIKSQRPLLFMMV